MRDTLLKHTFISCRITKSYAESVTRVIPSNMIG